MLYLEQEKEALYLANEVVNKNLGELQVFIDNDKKKQGSIIGGTRVVLLEQDKSEYRDTEAKILLAIRGSYSRLAVLHQLKK